MTDQAVIRPAGPDDAPALHAALAALSRHLGVAGKFRARPEDYARHGFGQQPLFRALIAEAGGETCGAATYFPEFSTLRGRAGVYLQDLWVEDARRGSGLGRRLLAAVVREASGWGAAYMRLSAHATNPEAIAFYHRIGFESDEDEMSFVIDGDGFTRLEVQR